MNNSCALISIRPAFSEKIFTKKKTFELRRREPKFNPGMRLLIYSTLPNGYIEGYAVVSEIISATPEQLWADYSNEFCISKEDFDNYFDGCNAGFAIRLTKPKRFTKPLSLYTLRKRLPHFQPPQSYCYISKSLMNILDNYLGMSLACEGY